MISAFHSGIGGGGFALIKTRGNDPVMLDYRETAPGAAHRDMFVGKPINASLWGYVRLAHCSGLAVAVPGEVRGWEQLHRLYGRLSWAEILEPAVHIAKRGFRVPSELYNKMHLVENQLCAAPSLAPVYCPDGQIWQQGELRRREDLGSTLERIAQEGADAFYNGRIAQNTVDTVQAAGGILTLEDLRRFQVLFRDAHAIEYRDKYRVWTTSAPSSGAVLLSILKTMEHFPDTPYEMDDVLHTHRLIEATKFSYGERSMFGDPAFVKNVTRLEALAIQDDIGQARHRRIWDDGVHPVEDYNPEHFLAKEDHGTSHLSAVDEHGMSISITTTVNGYWGSALITPDGILLNNDMDDFSSPDRSNLFGYVPTPANYIAPYKRPLSSMCPFMVQNKETGEMELVAGSAGGSRIITANLLMAYTFMSYHGNVSMQDVINRPRWHDQIQPEWTLFERPVDAMPHFPGYNNDTVRSLERLGHVPVYVDPGTSTSQAIQRSLAGVFQTASEPRQWEARGAAV